MANRPINDLEANATSVARRELREPVKIAMRVLELATTLLANDIPEEKLPTIKFVRLLLLQRIQNDLRCCLILVECGYALQAAALAAGIFEAWITLANINNDEDTKKWLSHIRENKSFGDDIYSLTENALKTLGGDVKDAKKHYSQYQQLCMAKHLNPIVERNRGYEFDGESVHFLPGPDTSDRAIALGWFALELASRFASLGLLTIASRQEISEEVRREFECSQVELKAVIEKGVKRWPNYLGTW